MGHSRAHIFDVEASVCVYAHLLIDLLRQLLELCLQSHNFSSAFLSQNGNCCLPNAGLAAMTQP